MMNFDRSKLIAIMTGAFSLLLGILYLLMVQLLDMRGQMIPAPLSLLGLLEIHVVKADSLWIYLR
jgi:hypothetical protein